MLGLIVFVGSMVGLFFPDEVVILKQHQKHRNTCFSRHLLAASHAVVASFLPQSSVAVLLCLLVCLSLLFRSLKTKYWWFQQGPQKQQTVGLLLKRKNLTCLIEATARLSQLHSQHEDARGYGGALGGSATILGFPCCPSSN